MDEVIALDGRDDVRQSGLKAMEVAVMAATSAAMIAATALGAWSIGWTEVIGFVTGGVCVWLIVRENMWNWPIGLANNIVFFVLFTQARLFADAGLQIVYLFLGIYGWWHWLRGGEQRSELKVTHAPVRELLLLAAAVPVATWGVREVLVLANGSAPFLDALTTVISLAAQILTCRKRIESWPVWITVDIIYIPLYLSRGLPLIAVLYGVFLIMCLAGWRQWRASYLSGLRT